LNSISVALHDVAARERRARTLSGNGMDATENGTFAIAAKVLLVGVWRRPPGAPGQAGLPVVTTLRLKSYSPLGQA